MTTLRRVFPFVYVTNEREESVVNQHNLFRKMLILIMKLHISACNGHHQLSRTIKKILYICEGVLMKGSLCINPLFALISSALDIRY